MGKSKIRTLLMASLTIMLCAAMIVGGTYALWSDTTTVSNHLAAGTLDVGLWRTKLTTRTLDENGYLTTTETPANAPAVDLAGSTTANVFGIEEGDLIVPQSSYEARLKLTNEGDVAFSYDVIIELKSASNELASQLKLTVDGVDKGYLANYELTGGRAVIESRVMTAGAAEEFFTVKIEFEDLSGNNAAKRQEASFDLLIVATQKTGE